MQETNEEQYQREKKAGMLTSVMHLVRYLSTFRRNNFSKEPIMPEQMLRQFAEEDQPTQASARLDDNSINPAS